jgi:YD repeat-containing protein
VTNPLGDTTAYEYGAHGRLTKITLPDEHVWHLAALQTIGLPAGASGNSLAGAAPLGSIIDERGFTSEFQTDRFGNLTLWIDQLGNQTQFVLNASGQIARLVEADPDGAGPAVSPVTVYGYDANGNLVYSKNPRGFNRSWSYVFPAELWS